MVLKATREVSKMAKKPFTINWNEPLFLRVGHLGEAYTEWVHQPIISKEVPRVFANNFFEYLLTRTVWWVIPLVWLPVIWWFVSISVQRGLTPPHLALSILGGIFIWTLVEYIVHRFLFHMKTKTYWWANAVHYVIHGCHHKHPMDRLRLVYPPAATTILCLPIWTLIRLLSTPSTAPALFGGAFLGYVIYDVTHYYLHHGKPSKGLTQSLKRYHLMHHFKVESMGFGVTSSIWDWVFRTLPPTKAAS